ncbi:MAG: serine hydroxymethyltransferase, partial [Rhodobacterales bacterium]|nr:serine hydroxymethyltransferase [Rhodobacterales bacterium]
EFRTIADLIVEVLDGLAANGAEGNAEVEASVKAKVQKLCDQFPIYDQL